VFGREALARTRRTARVVGRIAGASGGGDAGYLLVVDVPFEIRFLRNGRMRLRNAARSPREAGSAQTRINNHARPAIVADQATAQRHLSPTLREPIRDRRRIKRLANPPARLITR
jgi:hypothetical protein